MNNHRTLIRFFTISDYEEEEIWLRRQHQKGWKLVKMIVPCFYIFESCTPEDVVYRLDYKNNSENGDYFQIFQDYGWEYFARCTGWLYFRRPVSEADTEEEKEIFSDDSSRINMVNHILKTRMLPLVCVFFCCLLPQFINSMEENNPFADAVTMIFAILLLIYLYLFLHCGLKLRRLKKKYGDVR
ncbi:MAG: DUF2812 domain-containing protein [Lachnospiraceae bacterium]|jgi:hypothetical protein|nr:DUF2812 domain-containing protein [Lachnospiraceae bacterium]